MTSAPLSGFRRAGLAALGCTFLLVSAQIGQPHSAQGPEGLGPASLEVRQTHGAVEVVTLGDGEHRIYIFLPASPTVTGQAPMVFFHHGWQGMNPLNYGALIDHLARSGNVVLFPVYQSSDSTSPQIVVQNAAEAESRALAVLAARGIVPDPERVLYWGYSMGAAVSLRLAQDAARWRLPPPRALMLAAPGDAYHVAKGAEAQSILGDVESLPPTLPVAILTGEDDTVIGLPTGRKLMARLCGTRADRRVLIVLPTDEHEGVRVHAGHGSPGSPDSRYNIPLATPASKTPRSIPGRIGFEPSASLNQLDFYGYWKATDALLDSLAYAERTGESYAPPPELFRVGDPRQLYLGAWPDGTPFRPARVEDYCAAGR